MSSIFFAALFAVVATGLGWSVIVRCDHKAALTTAERLAMACAVGTLVLYFAVFAIGPFRLDKISMGLVVLAAGALAIPGLRTMPWAAMWGGGRDVLAQARDPWTAILWLAVVGIGLASVLQGLAPPNDSDSLSYHLALPQLDVEIGRIAPAWDRRMPHMFFPAGMHHLYRLALIFSDGGAAQLIHGLFGVVAAMATGTLARRMGASGTVALLAAGLFLAIRSVIWEMGTAEVDVASAAWLTLAVIVYLAWRDSGEAGLLVLLGLAIGGGILAKYHGIAASLAIGVVLLWDLAQGRMRPLHIVIAPLVALTIFIPHMGRAYILTGNPIFPLFNANLVPDGPDFMGYVSLAFGTGRGFLDLLTTPISASLLPMQYFDGMMLGAPYLLAFMPLAVLARESIRHAGPALTVATVFYLIWFYGMGHQVRFLTSIFPLFAVFAAIGAATLWRQIRPFVWARVAFGGLTLALATNQFLFVGGYAALRLPAALGIQSPAAYHRTPTMDGAYYVSCTYIRNHIAPGEKYLSLLSLHFYYCPQASAHLDVWPGEERAWLRTKPPLHPITSVEFLDFFEKNGFRFVIAQHTTESWAKSSAERSYAENALDKYRLGPFLAPALGTLTPLTRDAFGAVYDGRDVLAALKKTTHH